MSCQASWWGEVYYDTSIPDYNPPSYHSDTSKTSLDTPARMSGQASWWGEVYYDTSIPDYNPPSYHTTARNHSVSGQEEILAIRRRLQNIRNDIRENRQKYRANIPIKINTPIWKPKLAGHTVDTNKINTPIWKPKLAGHTVDTDKINTPIWKPKLARHHNLSPTIDNNVIDGNAVPIVKPKPADTTPTPPIDKPKIEESIIQVVAQIQTINEPAMKPAATPSVPINKPEELIMNTPLPPVVAQIQTANELAVKTALAVTPQTTTSVTGNQAKPLTSARNLVTTIASVLIAKLTQNGKHYTDTSSRCNIQNVPGNIAGTPKHTISEWLSRPPPQPPPSSSPTFEPEFYLHRTQCDCEVEIFHHTQCGRQTTPHLPVIEPLKVL